MARAQTVPLLSLDRWAELLGIDPRHFNQVITAAKPKTSCAEVYKQYSWQHNGQVGRDDVARVIKMAEDMVADYVTYQPLPTWVYDERCRVQLPGIADVTNLGSMDMRGFNLAVRAKWGQFVSPGIEAKSLIQAEAAVVYSDEDSDNYKETATVTVATTVTDPEEIAVYFPGEDANDQWEVRPLNNPITKRRSVVIAGGVCTIKMAREQLVKPELWDALNPQAVDGEVDANFLAEVDVYRHYNDPQTQVTLLWAQYANQCGCGSTSCATCALIAQTGCLTPKDYRSSQVYFQTADWNSDTSAFSITPSTVFRTPDNLRLFYRAGLRDMRRDAPLLEMDRQIELAIAYLAVTLLDRPLCGCSNVQALARKIVSDYAANISSGDQSTSFQLSDTVLDCPWGTTWGALQAWRIVNSGDRTIGRAALI